MNLDPVPEDVRQFLMKNFSDVLDEPSQGNYYVFSLRTNSGQGRHLKVHRNVFIYSEMVADYLRTYDFIGQLESGDVEIAEPLSSGR